MLAAAINMKWHALHTQTDTKATETRPATQTPPLPHHGGVLFTYIDVHAYTQLYKPYQITPILCTHVQQS